MSGEKYLVDSHALLSLQERCGDDRVLNEILLAFTDLVEDGTLYFPDGVWRECLSFDPGTRVSLWSKSVSGSREKHSPPSKFLEEALDLCDGLLDESGPDITSQLEIAQCGLYLKSLTYSVVIVTEDRMPMPGRTPLADGCNDLGLIEMGMGDFVSTFTSHAI